MADVSTTNTVSALRTAKERPPERTMVVRWWAVLGAAFILFELYLYTRWIVSGNATPNRGGASAAPGWMHAAVWIHVALGIVALAGWFWWYLVRPWRRERRITSDGLLMLGCMTAFWGDLAANYFRYWVVYPTVWPNLGAWYNFIPFWQTPRGQLQVEATIFFLPMYAVCMFGFTSIACAAMRRIKVRRPQTSKIALFLVAWLIMALVDLVLEIFWVRLGLFIYPGTIDALTLFNGHYYQFPIYEAVFWGLGWAILSSVRFFRNDRGETVVERGVSKLRTSQRQKTVLRFLALAAVANLSLLNYNLITALIATQASDWPKDVTSRPYFGYGLCGPDAENACPDGTAEER